MITRGKAAPAWIRRPAAAARLDSLPLKALAATPVNGEYHSLFGERIVFRVADLGHAGYPEGCVTLMGDMVVSGFCWDAMEPDSADSYRKRFGSNRYIHSNAAQWLNSAAADGQWFSPAHDCDTPPMAAYVYEGLDPCDHLPGFLRIFGQGFRERLLPTTLRVARSRVDGGGSDEFVARMFLPSTSEMGIGMENSIDEGAAFPIFSGYADRACQATPQAMANNSALAQGEIHWWLRTPQYTTSYGVRKISDTGTYSVGGPSMSGIGVRPVCNLPGNTPITPGEDGVYIIG